MEDLIYIYLCILVGIIILACCCIYFGRREISKPREVEISDISLGTITLTWKPPIRGREYIKLYTILSKRKGGSWQDRWTTPKERAVIRLDLLEKNIIHSFKIRPESGKEHGEESEEIDTSHKIPGKVDKLHDTSVNADFLNLEWGLPAHGADLVKGYTLYYRPVQRHSVWKEINSKGCERCLLVDDLDPETTYEFQVCPYGILGAGPKSDICRVTTSKSLATQLKEMSRLSGEKNSLEVYSLPLTRYKKGQYKCYIDELSYQSAEKKVLMLVGETGSGKTTLLNSLANYIVGVNMEGDFRFKVDVDRTGVPQAHSQTSNINTYSFYPMIGSRLPYELVVVDTPGFSDTRGYINDKQLVQEMEVFFKAKDHGINHLDGVGFVIRSSSSRLTVAQRYVFNAILKVFGKNFAKSLFLMITFADRKDPPVIEVIREARVPYNGTFYTFNNSALLAKPTKMQTNLWKMYMEKSFDIFFNDFRRTKGLSLQMTKENLETRHRLEDQLHHLLPVITLGLNKQHELKKKEDELKVYESRKIQNTDHIMKIVKNSFKIVKVPPNSYALNCEECHYTCHFPCNEVRRCDEQYNCEVMDANVHCKVCISKCSWKKHSLQSVRYKYESKEIEYINRDMKAKYDAANQGLERLRTDIRQLEGERFEIQKRVNDMIMQAKEYQDRLNEISLGSQDELTESQYIDTLIESEKRELKEGYQQRIEALEEFKAMSEISNEINEVKSEADASKWFANRLSRGSLQSNTRTPTFPRRRSTRNHKRPNLYTS